MKSANYILVLWFLLFWVSTLSFSKQNKIPPLLVITDLRTVGESSSSVESRAFSDFIRKELEKTGLYRILSPSSMRAILKSQSFRYPCFELPCFSEMGQLLGADEILAGNMKRQGATIEITLRRIDVKTARFLNTIRRTASGLPTSEFMGNWGRFLIAETFQIDPQKLAPLLPDGTITNLSVQTDLIPLSVSQKYPGMIYIPAGKTIVGSNQGDRSEIPPHQVLVDAFYIGKYEVTNEEYRQFVLATHHPPPQHWSGNNIPPGLERHPVTWVSFEDAEAYCLWKGGRLPTEAEWERAAHGETSRVYPWGNDFDPDKANVWQSGRKGTAPVGSFPLGASPFGVEDMAGNVFEWVNDFFQPYPGSKLRFNEADRAKRVLRGGSWNFNEFYARTTHRFARSGGEKSRSYGFRIVRDP